MTHFQSCNYKFRDWRNNINLERAVLLKTAGLLWRHVQGTFLNDNYFNESNHHILEDNCVKNIEMLPLPSRLREKVEKIIKPTGVEILKFSRNLMNTIVGKNCIAPQVPVNIVWTLQGALDTRKTYRLLINDESFDLRFRYKLACHCCLENDIAILWNQMCKEQKSYFLHYGDLESYLVEIWSRQIGNKEVLGQLANEEGFSYTYEFAFLESVSQLNKDAVEFFWKKLSNEVRRIVLPKAMTRIKDCTFLCNTFELGFYHICYCTEIVLFLYSRGDKEPLENLMQFSDHRVLVRLLDWPYHEYFLEVLDYMQLAVGSNTYNGILKKLVDKIVFGYHDFNYLLWFKIFLKQRTKFQRQSDQPIFPSTFDVISHFRDDAEATSLIQSYCKTVLKKDVSLGKYKFETLSDVEEWELVTFVIDECILKSKEVIFRSVGNVQTSCANYKNLATHNMLIWKIHLFLSKLIENKIKAPQSN